MSALGEAKKKTLFFLLCSDLSSALAWIRTKTTGNEKKISPLEADMVEAL